MHTQRENSFIDTENIYVLLYSKHDIGIYFQHRISTLLVIFMQFLLHFCLERSVCCSFERILFRDISTASGEEINTDGKFRIFVLLLRFH